MIPCVTPRNKATLTDDRNPKIQRQRLQEEKDVKGANIFYRLRSVPGIGKSLSLIILYEIHHIARFPHVQDFVSDYRLVQCAKESAGKKHGTSGKKIGNAYLKWAFSEAAVLFLRNNEAGQKYLARLEKKHGKAKALSLLAHRLARAVYSMLKREEAFDRSTFLQQG